MNSDTIFSPHNVWSRCAFHWAPQVRGSVQKYILRLWSLIQRRIDYIRFQRKKEINCWNYYDAYMQKILETFRENNSLYMYVKKYSDSDTIQCSGQSNIRILFVFFPFLCLRLSVCGFKDMIDLRVPTFYFVMF